MSKKKGTALVIVESPAKCKTIKKYLGPGYEVLASYGHVRDLVPKRGSVDIDNDFAMRYAPIDRNKKYVEMIAKAMRNADRLYLATDPDREGEAISWHLSCLLKAKGVLKGKDVSRLVFHQITERAVHQALEETRPISMDLVNAQQARRALDYLVGFNLSPLLWQKVLRGLSAGRVQSPALRLIVEREQAIEAFQTQEYWSILAHLSTEPEACVARMICYKGKKLKQFSVTQASEAETIIAHLKEIAEGYLTVVDKTEKQRRKNPTPPFITSTLQQEASRKLGFSASQTMQIAQQLYEGIKIGKDAEGLITYMRTDSVHLSEEALEAMRTYIAKHYPNASIKKARVFKSKVKNAQEAHEAIRPTVIARTPQSIRAHLTNDQWRVYQLIWVRALASQMSHATLCTVGIDFSCGNRDHLFRLTGTHVVDPGFMRVYEEGRDQKRDDQDGTEVQSNVPDFKVGERVPLADIVGKQHFTEPPPRYTEASLVKLLEEHGIGRPSTYASIVQTLYQRNYVIRNGKQLLPTDVGKVVSQFLVDYFTQYVDYNFTGQLEDQLDAVSRGEMAWTPLLKTFWHPFKALLDKIGREVDRKDVAQKELDEKCPTCGKPLSLRLSRNGQFIGCTGYPDCNYTRDVARDSEDGENTAARNEKKLEGRSCPTCGKGLFTRVGRYGKFIGCEGYPICRYIEPLEKPKALGITCPSCKAHELLERKTRRGGLFFACSGYPKCRYAQWERPIEEACPKCKWPLLGLKETKRKTEKVCPQKECSYSEMIAETKEMKKDEEKPL